MTEENKKQDKLLDTTDCLEAVGTLKSIKNLFFFVSFLCLFILQGVFWLTPTQYVVRPGKESTKNICPVTTMVLKLSAVSEKEVKVDSKSEKIEKAAQILTADANSRAADPNAVSAIQFSQVKINFEHLAWVVRICSYLLAVSAVVYSLTLLFAMNVSLVGKLGGINHITKAVFLSFVLVVLILPWQLIFRPVLFGVIYTPAELLGAWGNFDKASIGAAGLMILRFTVSWFVAVVLLVCAQLRSLRWAKNTLKGLGITG
ncbi:MAG: hypothetical protein PHP01_01055 [Phycisphaerae bacterium]|nr:hypothetical protein [Phycisphaerae bacterium]